MLNIGVAGAAAFTDPPEIARAGDGNTVAQGTVHTTSLV